MNTIHITGNLTANPVVRHSPKGKAFVTFRIAENQGYRDENGRWVDLPPLFLPVIVNGKAARNAAATFRRGDAVIINGTLIDGTYVDDQGVRHSGVQLKAREIGPSLANATAEVTRNPKAEPEHTEPERTESERTESEPVEPAAETAAEAAAEPAKPAARRTRASKRGKPAEPAEQERPAA